MTTKKTTTKKGAKKATAKKRATKKTTKKPVVKKIKVQGESTTEKVRVDIVRPMTATEAVLELYRMDKAEVEKAFSLLKKAWKAEKAQERYEKRAQIANDRLRKLLGGEK